MIAQAGLLSYRMGHVTPLAKSSCTQRYVTSLLPDLSPSSTFCFSGSEQIKCSFLGDPEREGTLLYNMYATFMIRQQNKRFH